MDSVFHSARFIKADRPFDPTYRKKNLAPMFRKKVVLDDTRNAKLYVCGLGFAYYYVNGKAVSPDLFTSADSQYDKTLWYHVYDVSSLLHRGENTLAVICGNGWYNEEFATPWDHNKIPYRDNPKFILRLDVGGLDVLCSDGTWRCQPESAIWFNALRSGEYFDARLYDENWNQADFDDSAWELAVLDTNPPSGTFRECRCEPIREFDVLEPQSVTRLEDGAYRFDMGKNCSGYIRLTVTGRVGQALTIRYGEFLNAQGRVAMPTTFYPESEFQTDRFVCSGKPITWSPRFAYHGFRYIEIEGLESLDGVTVQSAFVHQAVARRTSFSCSEPLLNQLYDMGVRACYSNMFYKLTDCPSREKMGWTNDAHISCEQFFTNFEVERLLEKWMVDICDAMREDGMLSGIVPSSGFFGYDWGNGPLSDGILFEIPYRMYLHTGDPSMLIQTLPYFDRYLALLETKKDREGWISSFGLGDWTTVGHISDIPLAMTNAVLVYQFYRVAELAAKLAGKRETEARYGDMADEMKDRIVQTWISPDGRCRIHEMTAVAILIAHGLYRELEPLKQQLRQIVEDYDYHHHCGMLGLRYLYEALEACGLEEYAYRIVTAKGYPSYSNWCEVGATTFCEYWRAYSPDDKSYRSQNHHLYSDVLSWMIKSVLGLHHQKADPNQPEITVKPYFFEALTRAEGSYRVEGGEVSVAWERRGEEVRLTVAVKGSVTASYNGAILPVGTHQFTVRRAI